MEKRIAIFPGSFDPFTVGHESIVERALPLFDEIIIAIGVNPEKKSFLTEEERVKLISDFYKDNDQIKVVAYQGLTVDIAKEYNARFILRGVREVKDFEYERTLGTMNREISGLETVLLYTLPELGHVSSSLVKELIHYNVDISKYIPKGMVLPKK